jgi:hypothetical protein
MGGRHSFFVFVLVYYSTPEGLGPDRAERQLSHCRQSGNLLLSVCETGDLATYIFFVVTGNENWKLPCGRIPVSMHHRI